MPLAQRRHLGDSTAMNSIRVDTIRALLQGGYELGVHCAGCDRWGTAPLEKLVLLGHGSCRFAGMAFRCQRCGSTTSTLQVRPPAPTRDQQTVGWIGPDSR